MMYRAFPPVEVGILKFIQFHLGQANISQDLPPALIFLNFATQISIILAKSSAADWYPEA